MLGLSQWFRTLDSVEKAISDGFQPQEFERN
jgi:hypothetical protein